MTRATSCAVLALSVAVCAPDARACHNGVELRVVPLTRTVSEAATALADDHPERAVTLAGRAIRRIRGERPNARNRHLMNRAKRILALAAVRLDGGVDTEHLVVAAGARPEDRQAALRWALGVLEHAFAGDGGPAATAAYAEALARFASQRARARTLLAGLAARDLMPDASGYRALAALEEGAARERALAGCRARAGARAARVCQVPAAGEG
ncbi:MAG: hypothetical protein KF729_06550 [Sandaracinaceae bacterium]|nr:hypothetical protein [Sandaracinaceae bacterium]